MARKLDPGSDRVEACFAALQQLREDHGKEGKPASVNAVALKTKLRQQNLQKLQATRAIGIEFADQIASHFETTIDGLVWLFRRGGVGSVRVGDIPGRARAAQEAAEEWGADPLFLAAAEIKLPVAPSRVNKDFAFDLVQFLRKYTTSSHTRLRAQKVPG